MTGDLTDDERHAALSAALETGFGRPLPDSPAIRAAWAAAAWASPGIGGWALDCATRLCDPAVARWVMGQGVPLDHAALLGAGRVRLLSDGGAEPVQDERAGVPVLTAGLTDAAGDIVEVLAVDPAAGRAWLLLDAVGLATTDLAAVEAAGWPAGRLLRLHGTALGWLRAGGEAYHLWIADWDRPLARELLAGLDAGALRVQCDDDAAAAALRERVRPRRAKLDITAAAAAEALEAA